MFLLKRIHFWFGLAVIFVFLMTGQYMAHFVNDLQELASPRMLYRSAHIYVLLAALANLLVGVYLTPEVHDRAGRLQVLISACLLIAPLLLLYGFIYESMNLDLNRPVLKSGLYILFASAVLLVIQAYRWRMR